jgi:hypothetical protein
MSRIHGSLQSLPNPYIEKELGPQQTKKVKASQSRLFLRKMAQNELHKSNQKMVERIERIHNRKGRYSNYFGPDNHLTVKLNVRDSNHSHC